MSPGSTPNQMAKVYLPVVVVYGYTSLSPMALPYRAVWLRRCLYLDRWYIPVDCVHFGCCHGDAGRKRRRREREGGRRSFKANCHRLRGSGGWSGDGEANTDARTQNACRLSHRIGITGDISICFYPNPAALSTRTLYIYVAFNRKATYSFIFPLSFRTRCIWAHRFPSNVSFRLFRSIFIVKIRITV